MKQGGENNVVLLGQKDPDLSREISSKLRVRGIEVVSVSDGSKTLEMALLKVPDLLIVDTDLDIIPTAKLIQIIRTNPRTKDIPVIYISEESRSIPLFRQGFDEFVKRPFNVKEFILKISRILRHGSHDGEFFSADTEVSGKLSQISLPDLLQMFIMNRKNGVLHVDDGGKRGTIYIQDGKIVSAVSGSAIGEKGFYRLMALQEGSFQFVPGSYDSRVTIDRESTNLILEGIRRFDEMAKERDDLPSPSDHVELMRRPVDLPIGSSHILRELIMLLEFYTKVEDIVDASGFPDYDVYNLLKKLSDRGFIKVGSQRKEQHKFEFIDADMIIKLRSRGGRILIGSDNSSILGRITFFLPDDFVLDRIVSALKVSSEFELDRYFFSVRNIQDTPLTGVFGYLNVGENSKIALLSFMYRRELSPLWYAISRESLGSILILKDEASSSLEDLLAVSEYARAKGNGTMIGIMSRKLSNFGLGSNYLTLFHQRVEKLGCQLILREVDEISSDEIKYGVKEILRKNLENKEEGDDRSPHSLHLQ